MRIWLWLVILVLTMSAPAMAQIELAWAPAETTLTLGDTAVLSIMLNDTVDVRTIEVRIQYDATLITSLDGSPGALFQGYNLFENYEDEGPGQWHGYSIIMGASDWLTGPGELYRWEVRAAPDVVGTCDVVTVDILLLQPDASHFPEGVDLTGTWVRVSDPVTDAGTPPRPDPSGLRLYPNPFNPRVTITLPSASEPIGPEARIDVLDVLGRLVDVLGPPGADGWTWDGRDARGRELPSGVYRFVLRQNDRLSLRSAGVLVR